MFEVTYSAVFILPDSFNKDVLSLSRVLPSDLGSRLRFLGASNCGHCAVLRVLSRDTTVLTNPDFSGLERGAHRFTRPDL